MKLKDSTTCGPEVQGDVAHSVVVSDGEAIGTNTLRPGSRTCAPTVQPDQELITETGLPVDLVELCPTVPVTLPQ